MKMEFWCCDCGIYRRISVHGDCATCGSHAIVETPGEIEPVYIPEKTTVSIGTLTVALIGGVLVLASILATWWMLAGMP